MRAMLMAAVVAGAALATAAADDRPTKQTWEPNLSAAYKKALNEGKPMVVVFGSDWCKACVKQTALFDDDRVLDAYAGKAVFVRADPEHDDAFGNVKKLMAELEIKHFPTVVVMTVTKDHFGEKGRVVGHFPKAEFLPKFDAALGK